MIRVLLVEPTASGGLAAHVADEEAALAAAGIAAERADVRIRPRPHLAADLATVRALRRRVARGDVTAVHAHGLRAGALSSLALGSRARRARSRGPRLVVTLHNRTVGGRARRALGHALLRILCRRADTVLAVSGDLARDASAAGARDVRTAIVPARLREPGEPPAPPTGVTATSGTPGTHGPLGPLAALVIARLAPQKGLGTSLDAAAVLRTRAPGTVRFRVVGDGPLHDELAARIDAEHLDVESLGRRDDVPRLLAASDLVVSAAVWEGQPVSLQEALHAGRAVVATDAGGTREVTGGAAVLVPVGDAAAIAAAVLSLSDPAARAQREAASRQRAADLPTIEDMTTQPRAVLAPERGR